MNSHPPLSAQSLRLRIERLERARLKAQEVIGIPAANRMPITKQEAAAIGKPIFNAPEGSGTIEAIKRGAAGISIHYGQAEDEKPVMKYHDGYHLRRVA